MVTCIKVITQCCLIIAALFISSYRGHSQVLKEGGNADGTMYHDDLFRNAHWEFIFHPNLTVKAHTTHLSDAKYQLMTSPQISYELGVQRLSHLQNNLSLLVGLHLGMVGRNSAFIIPSEEIGYDFGDYPFNGPIARSRDIFYFSVPIGLEYRKWLKTDRILLVHGGLSLRFAQFNATSNADMSVMEVKLKGNKSPFVNFNGGLGYGFVLTNKDILKIGININVDPSYIAKGPFFLSTESSYDNGEYKVRGTAFGLYFIYSRTRFHR